MAFLSQKSKIEEKEEMEDKFLVVWYIGFLFITTTYFGCLHSQKKVQIELLVYSFRGQMSILDDG